MIPPVRQEILRRLERLSELAPDMRFGQLIASLAFLAAGPWDQTLWDLEDEQLLAAIEQHLADLARRQQGVASREAAPET
jgi:hypothetical protein